MASLVSPLRDRDFIARSQMPVYEQVLDVLGDVLYDADDLLGLLKSDATPRDYRWLEPEIQTIYDHVNSLMKKMSE